MTIIEQIKNETGAIAILIDPEKTNKKKDLITLINKINSSCISYIFIGGSTEKEIKLDPIIKTIKTVTKIPVVIFPGNHSQVSKFADAILYLSLLTTKNSKYLIEEQLKSTPLISKTKLEVIPTGYILIDENGQSSTAKITKNTTKNITKKELLNLSLTAKYLGKELVLIDAGSGTKNPIEKTDLQNIKQKINIPIIVGGGIKSTKEIISLKKIGVNIIIVGNHIEENIGFLDEISTSNLYKK